MIAVDPLDVAVAAHSAAYDAFQVAPGGDDSEETMAANCAMLDALDALVVAATAFPILSRPLPSGAGALLAHLRWWLADEAPNAEDYQPAYGILHGRAADLAAVLEPSAADESDPVVTAVVAADMAALTHTVTLVHRDEADDASEAAVDAAVAARDEAFRVVQQAMPATLPGLLTLVRYYGRDCRIYDGCGSGAVYFEHVTAAVAALIAHDSTGWISSPEDYFSTRSQAFKPTIPRAEKGVPGQPEIQAAWLALPSAERDRIGFIAVDMVFQGFVHGDDCVAVGQPEDRPVRGRSKAHKAIRAAADEACCARLTELHKTVERAIPDLFGPAGENPDWAVAMGARR